jgi:hypothetical protein
MSLIRLGSSHKKSESFLMSVVLGKSKMLDYLSSVLVSMLTFPGDELEEMFNIGSR